MKKSILFFITLSCLFSCSTEDFEINTPSSPVTRTDAIDIAIQAHKEFFSMDSRCSSLPIVDENAVYCYSERNVRSNSSDSLFYVVNFVDDGGFAIVNRHTEGTPILGISDHGHYNPYEYQENENFQYFIDNLISYTGTRQSISVSPIGPVTPPYNPPGICPAKIELQWNQNGIYGQFCSNHTVGCTNIAGAMIMAYFQQPAVLPITYDDSDEMLTLNWWEIKKHKRERSDCSENDPSSIHYSIAKLCRQLGFLNSSIYHANQTTSASENNLKATLRSFGYTCTDYVNFSDIDYTHYLDNNYILLVKGVRLSDTTSNTYSAHLWILDGYKRMYTIPDADGNYNVTTYCHYNWGWGGNSNGYFLAGVFDTSRGQYDNSAWGTSNRNYDYGTTISAVTYTH